MHETDARQVFAPFARVSGHAFAHIVRRQWVRLEAYAVFAFVVLAWRSLRIHHGNQRCTFAEFAGKFVRTLAHVIVDAIDANATILAHMILTVVNVFGAIGSAVAGCAFARIMREMIDAFGIVFARIEVGAIWDFRFAEFTSETRRTFACVRFNAVDACGIVLAFIFAAIVNVHLASGSRVASHATATESSFFEHGASGIIATRISVACVDHEFAMFAMETGLAHTFVLTFGLRLADGIILARECVTGVAFR